MLDQAEIDEAFDDMRHLTCESCGSTKFIQKAENCKPICQCCECGFLMPNTLLNGWTLSEERLGIKAVVAASQNLAGAVERYATVVALRKAEGYDVELDFYG